MSDTERPHHSNGVCLSCGGRVDTSGMAEGGEVEAEGTEDVIVGPVVDEGDDTAARNARDFALSLQGAH